MATVLMTWELGSGIGHLMRLRPLGQELVRRGHRVVAALRDVSRAGVLFAGTGIEFMTAPTYSRRAARPFEPARSYAHILANVGFSDEETLESLLRAWNTIFDLVRPNLVVTDHSPTALLALAGRPTPRVNAGLGFFCPPDVFPLPFSPSNQPHHADKMAEDEKAITAAVNRVMARSGRPGVERLGRLYNDIQEVFLTTYPEFDHFGQRPGVRYWGHWGFDQGIAPVWPDGNGTKIYAYLKTNPGLEELLGLIKRKQLPTIAYCPDLDPKVEARAACPTLRFERRPLDLRQAAAECDLAITNAGHGTTVTLLLAGKPCLMAPLYTEQLLFARKVEQMGAGLVLTSKPGPEGMEALQSMLSNESYRNHARAFAERYKRVNAGEQIMEIVNRMELHMR